MKRNTLGSLAAGTWRHAQRAMLGLLAALIMNSPLWAGSFIVTDVVDGDTVIVNGNIRVQLLGVNALGHSWGTTAQSQDFDSRSTAFTTHYLKGKKVRLEYDPANGRQDHRDAWDRVLAYVYLEDGSLFNLTMLEQGYARAYTKYIFKHAHQFQAAQQRAQAAGRGLWALYRAQPGRTAKVREPVVVQNGSQVYYKVSCRAVKNIPREDLIFFHEEEEARRLGYIPARSCTSMHDAANDYWPVPGADSLR